MVLYINGNYPFHSLHGELVSKLANIGNDIVVFVPLKGRELIGKYDIKQKNTRVIYSDILNESDRFFFIRKIKKIVKEIEDEIDVKKVDCILAGTVYSDGAVAYLLHKKYHIPFSVTVRETDVSYHMRWRPYLNSFVKSILKEASHVIFISPSYQRYFDRFKCEKGKYHIIPNAVNDYWYQINNGKRFLHSPLSMIYVGEISKRKNVETSIKVIEELKNRGILAVLNIVGSGDEQIHCQKLARKLGLSDNIYFHGWQDSKDTIKKFYDFADVFIMPSFRETFGTVYVEALTQGLPLIYTTGQGIDGYFDQGVIGYACKPRDILGIADAIQKIIYDYNSFSVRCYNKSNLFKWSKVSEQYNEVIRDMRSR